MKRRYREALAIWMAAVIAVLGAGRAGAATEALNWNLAGRTNIVCIYGEITVLTSIPGIYFCGAQWGGVDGYCGIQHNGPKERRTIFSIWDTSPTLRPKVTAADPRTQHDRFGGEGEGAHTHMIWPWTHGETFRFFLRKGPGAQKGTTDTAYYVCDASGVWIHSATITSPDGRHGRGKTFIDLCSWIENFADADLATPKIALYDLWVGADIDDLKHVTRMGGESGSGRWGQIHGSYFLAEGSREQIAAAFAPRVAIYGQPVYGTDGEELPPIPERILSPEARKLLREL